MSKVLDLLHQHRPNYHPLVEIMGIAYDADADLRLRFDCHKAIAKYIEPELRSVEHVAKDGANLKSFNIIISE